ncbi:ABC transporter ATP-binding protein/permease [Aquibacillus koreensis]|uniref:ABC transporter ATP-binding protein/permease n=1 Tax=Aquibacillus koreensis TaxID=279446 RepID=A0A9X4AHR6_9BACI|nr:ABC transporter ATP-binding protein [Aquibacillus koreensis]MCT2535780.1 ABC transporter ATP-binding protein/permease [Aquibacillus koreensis]MDC3420236.1 ABC transporter ATP-binding protein/permease [Aquibacillus koreensis]
MFSVFRKLDWFFKQYWKRYTFAILALIVASIIDIIPPKLIGMAIDEIQYSTLTMESLLDILMIYGILIVLSYTISFLWDYTLFGGAFIMERLMRSKLMRHFLKMTPTFFGKYRTGDLMAKATNDLKAISMTTGFGILTLVDSSIFMFMIIAVMGFTISWKLTLMALIPLPIMAVVMHKYGSIIHERFMKAQAAFSDMNNDVLESIRGVRVIRAYAQEKQDEQRFQNMTEDVYHKNLEVAKIDALFEPTMKVLIGISYTIGIGYGATLVFHNHLTLGQLVSFNVYLGMLIWPMFAVGELINVMQRGNASLDRVNDTLSYQSDINVPLNPKDISVPEHIKMDHVSFAYPDSKTWSLSDINITIYRGQTIGIVGKTGTGKTTLLRQLLREYPGKTGNLLISGTPIEEIALDKTREWIGYVPQDQIMFSKTIRENIQFGRADATDDQIKHVMKMAHFLDDIESLPKGLDTKVGESGVTLSGGQKQRVALARAFIKDPEILLLDDALSAVDGKTESMIIDHLKEQRKGKTTCITAHRLSAVMHADLIVVLDEGKIIESGTHKDLMKTQGWYCEQFKLQQLEQQEVVS